MHGRRPWILLLVLPALLPLTGCDEVRPPEPAAACSSEDAAPRPDSRFDPARAGSIRGRVSWTGEPPQAPPLRPALPGAVPESFGGRNEWPNPHAPLIDPVSRGLRDAVVFLRGVDPACARPWDHGPVTVRQGGLRLWVAQDGRESQVGFVRRGDAVTAISDDAAFYALHAGGAAYFSLGFPDPGRPRRRPLPECGEVELTSAAGHAWMRGTLFVDEHPYYARTDEQGRYTLPAVSAGRYEAVCWLPDPRIVRRERDPETGAVARITFAPARRQTRPVEVAAGGTIELDWEWSPP